ncbi:MAG: hypothetical protein ACRDSN_16470, partial [Pseudonocardiaceae bacterium]
MITWPFAEVVAAVVVAAVVVAAGRRGAAVVVVGSAGWSLGEQPTLNASAARIVGTAKRIRKAGFLSLVQLV